LPDDVDRGFEFVALGEGVAWVGRLGYPMLVATGIVEGLRLATLPVEDPCFALRSPEEPGAPLTIPVGLVTQELRPGD
jgi:hypothetical protein